MTIDACRRLRSEAELRAIIGEPTRLVQQKIASGLADGHRPFIAAAPLVMIATADPAGGCDVSPRGDPAGFVRILDAQTLLVPERPGNRLADTLRNLLAHPQIGLLFVIPGVADTLRVNGRGWITDDADLLAPSAIEGKPPALGIVVEIDEVYTQCGKALLRSDAWNPARFVERAALPSNGVIMAALNAEVDAETYDAERAARYARREGFY